MDVIERVPGRWRVVAGGDVDPVPPEVLGEQTPGIRITDDGRTSDLGCLVIFGAGLLEIEVGGDTTVDATWRADPAGVFLADSGGGSGTLYGEFLRPRRWLLDACRVGVEEPHRTLWNDDGETIARLERLPGTPEPAPAVGGDSRATRLSVGLRAAEHGELLGAWRPLIDPPWSDWHWQNLEFAGDGSWRAFPLVNIGGGRWRHGPGGTLLVAPTGKTQRMILGWLDLDPWLFPVARAGFAGDELVLLDEANHELQRLRRTDETSQ